MLLCIANHIFEQHERLVLGDFSFACDVSNGVTVSTHATRSLCCAAPEVAALYLRSTTAHDSSTSSNMKATYAMDMWSVGAVLFHMATGESLFLTNHHSDVDADQIDLLCHWPDYAKAKRMKKISFPCVRNLVEQLLYMDPTLRPTASECLAHPMIVCQYDGLRYVGMEARYDLYVSFRYESNDSSDLQHSLHIIQTLQTQGYTAIHSLHMQSSGLHQQVLDTLYNMTQARCMCIVLSRYAVNHTDFNLAQLHAYSAITLFLLEVYLALELKARGMLEQGIVVICVGDVVAQTSDGEVVYGPFFTHHGGEMTMKTSGCMPDRIPNVHIKAIQETISTVLMQHGLGKRLLGDMGLKETIHNLLDLPCLYLLGAHTQAFSTLNQDIVSILQQQVNKELRTNALRSSRPATSFQRMFSASLPSLQDAIRPVKTPTNWLKDRDPTVIHVPPSPLHNLTISDIITAATGDGDGGIVGSLSSSSSPSMKPVSRQRGRTPHTPFAPVLPEGEDEDNSVHNITYINTVTKTNSHLPQQDPFLPSSSQDNVIMPYFTEIAHVDKTSTASTMQYLYEKVDVKEAEICNLKIELKMMEEQMHNMRQHMQRLRGLVRVTDPYLVRDEDCV
ncbi:hypothetical protein EON65_24470 [archaeon]|nr:MAG: hypothetical protein EON65_24470 [archaeon]